MTRVEYGVCYTKGLGTGLKHDSTLRLTFEKTNEVASHDLAFVPVAPCPQTRRKARRHEFLATTRKRAAAGTGYGPKLMIPIDTHFRGSRRCRTRCKARCRPAGLSSGRAGFAPAGQRTESHELIAITQSFRTGIARSHSKRLRPGFCVPLEHSLLRRRAWFSSSRRDSDGASSTSTLGLWHVLSLQLNKSTAPFLS